jgi:hypothetical protein
MARAIQFWTKVDAEEVKHLAVWIGRSSGYVRDRVRRRVLQAVKETLAVARMEAPGENLPTRLNWGRVGDMQYEIKPYGYSRAGTEWAVPYEDVVDILAHGAEPHMIFPSTRMALWWEGLEHPVPWVGPPMTNYHPGVGPNDFLARAVETADALGIYETAVRDMIVDIETVILTPEAA